MLNRVGSQGKVCSQPANRDFADSDPVNQPFWDTPNGPGGSGCSGQSLRVDVCKLAKKSGTRCPRPLPSSQANSTLGMGRHAWARCWGTARFWTSTSRTPKATVIPPCATGSASVFASGLSSIHIVPRLCRTTTGWKRGRSSLFLRSAPRAECVLELQSRGGLTHPCS
jgi:hypothetical protein